MNHSLSRLLRLRVLLEDVSRVELEARLQELTQIESALVQSKNIGSAMRQQKFSSIAQSQIADWLEAQAVGDWVTRELGMLEKMSGNKRAEVIDAQAGYLLRRKERRQVESVMEARRSARAIEQSRREQRALDDWFGQGSGRIINQGTDLT